MFTYAFVRFIVFHTHRLFLCFQNHVLGVTMTIVSHGARVLSRVVEEPERGCVSPASGALTSGSLRIATSSV